MTQQVVHQYNSQHGLRYGRRADADTGIVTTVSRHFAHRVDQPPTCRAGQLGAGTAEEVLDEAFGLGPLELLLKDNTISDIMINGPKNIYCERRGKMEKSTVNFRNNDHLLQIIDRIISKVGRRVDETCPIADARLPDGSRVNIIAPPLAIDGCSISIR